MTDMTNMYNTSLTPEQEARFQVEMAGRLKDLYDYDMRGAWLHNAGQAGNGHYPDTYKKPNHPTFSRESMYSNRQNTGGQWIVGADGRDYFQPSVQNMKNMDARALQQYFKVAEPTARLDAKSMQEAINALAARAMRNF